MSTTLIEAPVSVDTVREVLGEKSTDIASLCASENVNMWSKHKPVKYKTKVVVPFDDKDGDWYKGENGDCGIVYNRNGAENNLASLYSKATWTYDQPEAKDDYPKRLTDFYKYCDYAAPFAWPSCSGEKEVFYNTFSGSTVYEDGTAVTPLTVGINNVSDLCVTLSDLQDVVDVDNTTASLSTCFLCVEFYQLLNGNTTPFDDDGNLVPERLELKETVKNDNTKTLGSGNGLSINLGTNWLQYLNYKASNSKGQDALYAFIGVTTNKGYKYSLPIQDDNLPYAKLYKITQVPLKVNVYGTVLKVSGSLVEKSGTTISFTGSDINNPFTIHTLIDARNLSAGAAWTFYSSSNCTTQSDDSKANTIYEFRITCYYGTNNDSKYIWYPKYRIGSLSADIEDSITVAAGNTYHVYMSLEFDAAYSMDKTPAGLIKNDGTKQFMIEFRAPNMGDWQQIGDAVTITYTSSSSNSKESSSTSD